MKLFKRSFVMPGLPENMPSSMWGKLVKRAHEVWDMNSVDDNIEAVRKRQDTAKVSKEEVSESVPNIGELVILLMGGRQFNARVLGVKESGLSLVCDEGYIDNIPVSWIYRSGK